MFLSGAYTLYPSSLDHVSRCLTLSTLSTAALGPFFQVSHITYTLYPSSRDHFSRCLTLSTLSTLPLGTTFPGVSHYLHCLPRQSPESLKRAQESSKETKGAEGSLKRARREPKTASREPHDRFFMLSNFLMYRYAGLGPAPARFWESLGASGKLLGT